MMSKKTVSQIILGSAEKRPDKTALARKENGSWKPTTYGELAEETARFSQALFAENFRPGDRLAIMLPNSPEWVITDLAALSFGVVDVPIYSTLSEEQVFHILSDSGAKGVVTTNGVQFKKLAKIAGNLPSLKLIITVEKTEKQVGDIRTVNFRDAMKRAGEISEEDNNELSGARKNVTPETLASIIYTSGTTGPAKGVMLSHGNFTSNVAAVLDALDINESDTHLSFLPLSHAFERTGGYYTVLAAGGSIYYAESMDSIPENMRDVKPTVVISVPRLFEKMAARIRAKVEKAPPLRQKLFRWAIGVGRRFSAAPEQASFCLKAAHAIARKLVFSKLQQAMGGRIRFFVSGGAPLGEDVATFFQAVGITIIEGYGLTETSPVIAVNPVGAVKIGSVGKPLGNLEIKIADDGELLVKGPSITKGYFRDEKATREAIDKDGWFHTGDVAELDGGYIKITDRKKNILVMSNGKNVAPQPIESRLVSDDLIAQAVVIGNSRKFISALIVPDFEGLSEFAKRWRIKAANSEELIASPEVFRIYEKKIARLMDGFARFEKVKRFALLPRELSEREGELTPTLKIKRKVVLEKYAALIDGLYESENSKLHDDGNEGEVNEVNNKDGSV